MRAVIAKRLRELIKDEFDGLYMESVDRTLYIPKHQRLMNPHTRALKELKREHRKKRR